MTAAKVRPAIVVGVVDRSPDYLIVPLTSRTSLFVPGEFALANWSDAGLNVPSVVKRGVYTIHASLIIKSLGHLSAADANQVEHSLRLWFELS